MNADELNHAIRDTVPDSLERGQTSTVKAELYVDGTLTAPSSGTVTVYDSSGRQVTTGSVTVSDSVATFGVTIDADQTLGDLYRVEWSLTVGATTYRHRTRAEVVRRRLVCPVSVIDLYRFSPQLNSSNTDALTRYTAADYASFVGEAWLWTLVKLREAGRRPDLVSGADALRECTLHKSLSLIFGALSLAGADRFQPMAELHENRAAQSFRAARLEYAPDDAENDRRDKRARPTTIWLMGT